jgi:threonine/homoserine/homoserine lactone efflux protein
MEQLSSFLFASILLTLTPGPDLLMVIAKSLEKGISAALYFTAGLMTGLCGHTLLLVLGWAQFIGERPEIVMWIKIAGCVYFSYLGAMSIYRHLKKKDQVFFENEFSEK